VEHDQEDKVISSWKINSEYTPYGNKYGEGIAKLTQKEFDDFRVIQTQRCQ
jgi:hypothetical protein